MPERQHDDHAKWFYRPTFPGMDLRMSPGAIDPRMLVEATGVDGRNEGGLRVFPGFGGVSIHGIPAPEVGVTTIEPINNIQLVKYASVRKGISPDTLAGLVILADNQTSTGKALYFAYRDSEDARYSVLTMPRVLSRLPYGASTKPVEEFDFEEVELVVEAILDQFAAAIRDIAAEWVTD